MLFLVGASHIQAIEGEHILPISSHPGIVGSTTSTTHNETKTKLVQQQLGVDFINVFAGIFCARFSYECLFF